MTTSPQRLTVRESGELPVAPPGAPRLPDPTEGARDPRPPPGGPVLPRHPRPPSCVGKGATPPVQAGGEDLPGARPEAPGAPSTPWRPPRASVSEAARLSRGRRARRPPPSPACRAPAARGLTASTACCRMEVNLENILSRDCSSLSRDDLESSSIRRRRRPCCGCRGRSRLKAGAGAEDEQRAAAGPARPLRVCAGPRQLRRVLGPGGRRGGRSARASGPRDAPAAAVGHGGSRRGFLPPALPAAACRGRRRRPGRSWPGRSCGGAARRRGGGRGRGGRGGSGAERRRRPLPASGRLGHG